MNIRTLAGAMAIAIALPVAASAATVFDFEGFSNAQQITSVSAGGITATVSATGGANIAVACDTGATTSECDDLDLLAPFDGMQFNGNFATGDSELGMVAIVQEAGTAPGVADAEASGGILTFTFDTLVELISVTIVDVESRATMSITLDGVQLTQPDPAKDGFSGNNLYEVFAPGTGGILGNVLSFRVSTSFAIDNITVQAVPVPAALPLLLAALGGLGLLRRRA